LQDCDGRACIAHSMLAVDKTATVLAACTPALPSSEGPCYIGRRQTFGSSR
jgi:hypothetical protein